MLAKHELEKLAAVDLESVDISQLTDIRDIEIDPNKSLKRKLSEFREKSSNPYIHRVGDYIVKVSFQQEGQTLDERLSECISEMRKIYIEA